MYEELWNTIKKRFQDRNFVITIVVIIVFLLLVVGVLMFQQPSQLQTSLSLTSDSPDFQIVFPEMHNEIPSPTAEVDISGYLTSARYCNYRGDYNVEVLFPEEGGDFYFGGDWEINIEPMPGARFDFATKTISSKDYGARQYFQSRSLVDRGIVIDEPRRAIVVRVDPLDPGTPLTSIDFTYGLQVPVCANDLSMCELTGSSGEVNLPVTGRQNCSPRTAPPVFSVAP